MLIYTIVKRDNIEDLIDSVQKLIHAGWRPLGGVVIDRKHCYQSMTRA